MQTSPRDALPTATIQSVWYEVEAWNHTAREGKKRSRRARLWAVWLAVISATLATLARWLVNTEVPEGWVMGLSLSSAAALATAGFLGRELLTPEKELGWVQARMLSEQLKREVWRCLAGVPPYRGEHAGRRLQERAGELVAEQTVSRLAPPGKRAISPPTMDTFDAYVDQRLRGQVRWYRRRAAGLEKRLRRLRWLGFGFGLAAVLAGVFGVVPAWGTSAWVPVLTTAVAAVTAHMQANRYGELIPVYQRTASRLDFLAAEWSDGWRVRCRHEGLSAAARQQLAEIEFIEACEAILGQENQAWQEEWLEGAAQQRTLEARRQLLEAAASQPDSSGVVQADGSASSSTWNGRTGANTTAPDGSIGYAPDDLGGGYEGDGDEGPDEGDGGEEPDDTYDDGGAVG